MTSPDRTVHIVVNGEFYGYRAIRDQLRAAGCQFSTESDSEIALHLYQQRGMQAMQQLRGEFAIVIADERERAMIAIRDRFGIKPLYYSVVNGDVFFASEIKALLALGVPAKWNVEGVYGGLGTIPRESPSLPASCRSAGLLRDCQGRSGSNLSVLGLGDSHRRANETRFAQ